MKNKTNNSDTALIGCGYWGTNIARSLISIGKKKIFVYDSNNKNSNLLKKRFKGNIIVEKRLNVILRNHFIKNIILATPPKDNLNLLKKCITYKKNIFIEKPGLKNLNEIKKIEKYKNKKILMFGYIYIFNKYIRFIKKFIFNKGNGRPLYIKFQRQNLGPIRNDVNVSYDLSSHDLSIILYLFNNLPNKINHNSYKILKNNISDISNLNFKLKNIFFDINNSWLNPEKVRKITVITSKKMLLFNELDDLNKIKIFNKYAEYPRINYFDNSYFKNKAKIYIGKNYTPKIKSNDPLCDELRHFFNCIKKNNKPITNISFAKKILKSLQKV